LTAAKNSSTGIVGWLQEFLVDRDRPQRDLAGGLTTLAVGVLVTAFLFWRNHYGEQMMFDEYNLLNTACILWIPLVVVMLFLRREPTDYGFAVGDTKEAMRLALGAVLLFLPVVLVIAPGDGPQAYYVPWLGNYGGSRALVFGMWHGTRHLSDHIDWARLAYHELVMGFYMFGWEYYFRGFLLSGLRRILPLWWAIGLQALFFFALHYGKPWPEMLSSLPGGVIMALVSIRYRSFIPCFVVHFLISLSFDFAVVFYHLHPHLSHLPVGLMPF